jgi:hypothetical protein
MRLCLPLVLIACANPALAAGSAEPPMFRADSEFRVAFRPLPERIPTGSSIPLTYTVTNISKAAASISMDQWANPALYMSILQASGRAPEMTGSLAEAEQRMARFKATAGTADLAPVNEPYLMKPGEQLVFQWDLAANSGFRTAKASKYSLNFATKDGTARASAAFTLVDHRALETRYVVGAFEPLVQYTGPVGVEKASARVSIIEALDKANPDQWVLVDKIFASGREQSDWPSYSLPVPAGTKMEKADMDFLGQVWVLVRCAERRSLLLWRLQDLSWSVLVPPTNKEIDFGTTRARFGVPNQIIVIAGLEGQQKFTTQSVWAMPRVEPPAAMALPTTRPVTRPGGG